LKDAFVILYQSKLLSDSSHIVKAMETTLVLRWSGVFPDLWGLYGNSISMSLRLYNHILCY